MNDTSEMKDVFQTYLSSMDQLTHVCAVPDSHSKVWKDECMFCYCDSECDGGLYINMKTFQGFCSKHLALDQEKHPEALYLIEKTTKVHRSMMIYVLDISCVLNDHFDGVDSKESYSRRQAKSRQNGHWCTWGI